MPIFDHWAAELLLVPFLSLVLFVWIRRAARKKPTLRRMLLPVVIGSGLVFVADGCVVATTHIETAPALYSPDHKKAIVVRNWSQGGVGGHGSDIELYTWEGFHEQTIAQGDVWTFSASGVSWLSNGDLQLNYKSADRPFCESTAAVRVTCVPTP